MHARSRALAKNIFPISSRWSEITPNIAFSSFLLISQILAVGWNFYPGQVGSYVCPHPLKTGPIVFLYTYLFIRGAVTHTHTHTSVEH